jgi:hypothetical protein
MAEVARLVSIAAGIAAVALLLFQFRESSRRDEEVSLLRDEARRRDEEIALLRRQVEGGEQARLMVFAGVQADSSERGIQYNVPVQNSGASGASQVAVELVNGEMETVGKNATLLSLVAGEKAYIGVMTPPRDRYTGPYEIFFEWDDGRGRQRAASGIQVGAP